MPTVPPFVCHLFSTTYSLLYTPSSEHSFSRAYDIYNLSRAANNYPLPTNFWSHSWFISLVSFFSQTSSLWGTSIFLSSLYMLFFLDVTLDYYILKGGAHKLICSACALQDDSISLYSPLGVDYWLFVGHTWLLKIWSCSCSGTWWHQVASIFQIIIFGFSTHMIASLFFFSLWGILQDCLQLIGQETR